MNRIQKLHILNSMYYEPTDISLDEIISSLNDKERGFDAIAIYKFKRQDELLEIEKEAIGIHRMPQSLEPEHPKNPEELLSIKEGSYFFMQLPVLDENQLKLELLPFIGGKEDGKVIVRIFKENRFEEIMQFMMKC